MCNLMLPRPLFHRIEVTTCVGYNRDGIQLTIPGRPCPGQRGDIGSTHQALTDAVNAVIDMIHFHHLLLR